MAETAISQEESVVLEVDSSVDDVSGASDTNEVLTDGDSYNFTYLQEKINAGGVIQLDKDVVKLEGESEITIAHNGYVILFGNNHKIDAKNTGRIFNISAESLLTLNNVILVNGNADNGGAIYNEGDLMIAQSVSFINNTANQYGGAVYSTGSTLSVSGEGIYFKNNKAIDGGAIYNNYTEHEFHVTGSVSFVNNTAEEYGGAIFTNTKVNVARFIFENNTAAVSGGAIYSKAPITVSASQFKSNTVTG